MTMQDIKVGDTVEALKSTTDIIAGNKYVVTGVSNVYGVGTFIDFLDESGEDNGWSAKYFKKVETEIWPFKEGDTVYGHFDVGTNTAIQPGRAYVVEEIKEDIYSGRTLMHVLCNETGKRFYSVSTSRFQREPVEPEPNYAQILQDFQDMIASTADNLTFLVEMRKKVEEAKSNLEKLAKCQKILTS